MTARTRLGLSAALATTALLLSVVASASATTTSPWWGLTSAARPTYMPPGARSTVVATASNIGDDSATGPVALTDRLPAGMTAKVVHTFAVVRGFGFTADIGPSGPLAALHLCTIEPRQVSCTYHDREELEALGAAPALVADFEALRPYVGHLEMRIGVNVAEEGVEASPLNEVAISGGGTAPRQILRPLTVSEEEAPFGIESFEFRLEEEGGAPTTQAGAHPFQLTNVLDFSQTAETKDVLGHQVADPVQLPRDLEFKLPAGLLGNTLSVPKCTEAQFQTQTPTGLACPEASVIGASTVTFDLPTNGGIVTGMSPVYNLAPTFGEPARFAFIAGGIFRIYLDARVRSDGDYGVTVSVSNIVQVTGLLASEVTFWGNPADPRHDASRGFSCLLGKPECAPLNATSPQAFLTMPTACPAEPESEPFMVSMSARSWAEPPSGPHPEASYSMQDALGNPKGLDGCNQLPFAPVLNAAPTSDAATSPTGLSTDLDVDDEGLLNPGGIAQSQIKKAVVTLPEGFTTNPSVAEGLGACTEAQYESETVDSAAGSGCPNSSKIGDVESESPLVDQKISGSLYVAKQGDNPFGSLLALYIVAKNPELGFLVKSAGKVEPNPVTGQLTTTFDDIPQLPFSHFHLSFRQGQRSPLITPPACGSYTVKADLYPWSNPSVPLEEKSSFQITQGPEGLPCPSGGVPPFHPGLLAGSENPTAGAYSPFYTDITRKDSEQEITHFSIKLPPGVIGKLAGVGECSDAQIAAAKAREHEGGGGEEEASPSCPASSLIGHSNVGSGVGNVLAYTPGKLYLAGPYHGSNLSIVSITAAKVGPFDLGTVVVRFALRIDPETAEVFVDSQGSDPIPHIVDGIPVHLRDIQAFVDRPEFTLNPTGCQKTSTASTVLGSGLNFASEADDQPVTVSSPFQVGSCASLGFKPKLALSLIGGTKRGDNPKFKAVFTPRPGDANLGSAQVTLPHSEFLDNAHIKTVCTRVQFKEGNVPGEKCPAGSVYGFAKAITPLLDEPVEGPVYLRSSSHQLPDLVAALHNKQVDIALDGHVEGVKGGIRNTFEAVPDAPVTKFTLEMQGGKKGLLQNSTNLCAHPHRASAEFVGHNGKVDDFRPLLAVSCGKHGKKGKHHHKRASLRRLRMAG